MFNQTGPTSPGSQDNESLRNSVLTPNIQFDTGSVGRSPEKSTLLEQEMKAIERFKEKQRKEIE